MLTDRKCRLAKPGPKPVKLFDAHGLHLNVRPTGTKSWRLKYRIAGREKQVVFGTYPTMRLAEARKLSSQARIALSEGRDPAREFGVKASRSWAAVDPLLTVEAVALDWHDLQKDSWKQTHAVHVLEALERDLFPTLGNRDIRYVSSEDVLDLLTKVQARGSLEAGHRLLQRVSAIFRYAKRKKIVTADPSEDLGPLLKKFTTRRQPALLTLPEAQTFLKAFEATPATPVVKLASRLLALTAARPGTVQFAEFSEFELDGAEPVWRIPAVKMKLRKAESEQDAFDFFIPLSRQAVDVVRAAHKLNPKRKYLFPSARHTDRPLTENSFSVSYRRVVGWEGKHVPHGWRASFSTIMNAVASDAGRDLDRPIIDLMLAHVPPGVEPLYNRGSYMTRRREIAQEWADLLSKDLASLGALLGSSSSTSILEPA